MRIAILTASDSRDELHDESGRLLERLLGAKHDVVARAIARDTTAALRGAANALLAEGAEVVVVNGGTGITPRDVTIEAFTPWFIKHIPGFGERFRAESVRHVGEAAWLSRATAATIRRQGRHALLVLLPGSPDACRLGAKLLLPDLAHAVTLLRGVRPHA